jgi:hypothetical protein
MSYNGKVTSFLGVVESAFRDSGLDFIDYENAIEWTANLIGLIGTPYVYVDKVTDGIDGMPLYLTVENYRASLPEDLVVLNSIRRINVDSDSNIIGYAPMIEASNIFHPNETIDNASTVVWNPLVNIDEFTPQTEDFVHERVPYTLQSSNQINGNTFEYKLDHGHVFTNFKDGAIQVAYRGFPIDAQGFPLIPDDASFKEALKWFIISKIDKINWRKNPSPQNKSILNDSEMERAFYIGKARNKSHIPSVDKMEAIKKMWLRSNPKIDEHSNGFSSLNKQEVRYNNNQGRRI